MISSYPSKQPYPVGGAIDILAWIGRESEIDQDLYGWHDSEKNLQDEKRLLNWLDDVSIERPFACIEDTSISTNMSRYQWRTETITSAQMFLRKLGVVK
ncbi:MAG: hypothetical protein LBQ71_03750 [Hungatella sp.]|jgi:hypothetical protein|nr:hypothetical protein [Hungatella sp.]